MTYKWHIYRKQAWKMIESSAEIHVFCCIETWVFCQRNMRPRSSLQCTDVPGWEDSAEFPCRDYEERMPLGLYFFYQTSWNLDYEWATQWIRSIVLLCRFLCLDQNDFRCTVKSEVVYIERWSWEQLESNVGRCWRILEPRIFRIGSMLRHLVESQCWLLSEYVHDMISVHFMICVYYSMQYIWYSTYSHFIIYIWHVFGAWTAIYIYILKIQTGSTDFESVTEWRTLMVNIP